MIHCVFRNEDVLVPQFHPTQTSCYTKVTRKNKKKDVTYGEDNTKDKK